MVIDMNTQTNTLTTNRNWASPTNRGPTGPSGPTGPAHRGPANLGSYGPTDRDSTIETTSETLAKLGITPTPTAGRRYMTCAQTAAKPLLNDRDLPGPLSLRALSDFGTVSQLDAVSGYQTTHADTLYGRSTILSTLVPHNTTVCALTAAWLWLGGLFPNTVDVISRSHYRTIVHDRSIRVFNRRSPPEHLIRVGDTRVTTPARTVCDLVLLPELAEDNGDTVDRMVTDMMQEYRVTPDDCLTILDRNPFWPRVAAARSIFEGLTG